MKNIYINIIIKTLRILSILLGLIQLIFVDYFLIISALTYTILSYSLEIICKKRILEISATGKLIANIFFITATIFGVGLNLYKILFWWDILVHFLSGILFTIIGVFISKKIEVKKKHTIIITLLIVMSITLSWEIIEFTIDSIFKTNLQEWDNMAKELISTNIRKRGHGLVDSMLDMIYAIFGYLSTIKVLE